MKTFSPRLVDSLRDLYPGSDHVHHCGLGETGDSAIWDYAKAHGFAIVSKDSDFAERSVLESLPPKIIWVRLATAQRLKSRRCCVQRVKWFEDFLKKMTRRASCWDSLTLEAVPAVFQSSPPAPPETAAALSAFAHSPLQSKTTRRDRSPETPTAALNAAATPFRM
jgi:predicted nuclease of predicted toxin-antitoxin system